MKEAISNAMIFNLIIVFVVILIMLFIGSLSYSKAFKVKNRIVEEIEKDEDYTENTVQDINNWISSEGVGYRLKSTTVSHNCPSQDDGVLDLRVRLFHIIVLAKMMVFWLVMVRVVILMIIVYMSIILVIGIQILINAVNITGLLRICILISQLLVI